MTTVVTKINGAISVVIPEEVARSLNLTDGASLDASVDSDAIVLRRPGRHPRRSMSELLAQVDPASYERRQRELGDDPPVVKERVGWAPPTNRR